MSDAYSISLIKPNQITGIKKEFSSKEEKEKYLRGEYYFTFKQLKKLWAAYTKEDRLKAKEDLYLARLNYYKSFNKPESRDVA